MSEPRVESECLNCGSTLSGPFCSQCGQEATEPIPTFRELVSDLVDEFLKVDSKVLRSFLVLLRYPGRLTTEYLAGKRVPYLAPVKMYLIASALYFLVENLPIGKGANLEAVKVQASQNAPKAVAEGMEFFIQNLAIISILLLPLYAAALALLYLGRRRRIVEYAVCTIHVWTASFVFYVPLWGMRVVGNLVPSLGFLGGATTLPYVVATLAYMTLAYRRVFGGSKCEAFFKAALSLGAAFFLSTVVVLVILVVFVFARR